MVLKGFGSSRKLQSNRGPYLLVEPPLNVRRNRIPNRGEGTHPQLLGGGSKYDSGMGFPLFLNPSPTNGGGIRPLQKGFPRLQEPQFFRGRRTCLAQMGFPHTIKPSPFSRKRNRAPLGKSHKKSPCGKARNNRIFCDSFVGNLLG